MKLAGFLAPVPDGPTFLHPLWQNKSSDDLYLHRTGTFGQIVEFVPSELKKTDDFYLLVKKPHKLKKSASEGMESPLAFRFPDDSVACGLPPHMHPKLRAVLPSLTDQPLLWFEILTQLQDETAIHKAMEEGEDFLRQRYSDELASQWRHEEEAKLHWLRHRPSLGRPSGFLGITVIDANYLTKLPPTTQDGAKNFLRGGLPDFRLVRDKVPARLGLAKRGLAALEKQRAILLEGAAGTGKTTAMLQMGVDLLAQGPWKKIFWVDSDQADPVALIKKEHDPVLLLIDQANRCQFMPKLLAFLAGSLEQNRVICTARQNEWNYARFRWNHPEHQPRKVNVRPLDDAAITLLVKQIVDFAAMDTHVSAEKVAQLLHQEKAMDLLAAMIVATHGKQLEDILRDSTARILQQPNGQRLVALLAAVAGMETRQDRSGRTHPATMTLLRETLRFSPDGLNFAMADLAGELTLIRRDYRKGGAGQFLFQEVHTRHPVIAEILWRLLTQEPGALIDPMALDMALFEGAARACNRGHQATPERTFTSILLEFRKRDGTPEEARRLFSLIPNHSPADPYLWQIWARYETQQGNVGSLETEFSARWLFHRSSEVDPNNAPTWQAWARLEEKQGNVGNLETEFSARWLFKRSSEADRNDAPTWQAWAMLEEKQDNVGSLETEFSARWLFHRGSEVDPNNAPTWQAWAILEEKQGNVDNLETEFSARWLFHRSSEVDPNNAPTWQAWAILEEKQGNVGNLETEFSARWLFHRGSKADPNHAHIWQAWALLEEKQGNVGNADLKWSAEWLKIRLRNCRQ